MREVTVPDVRPQVAAAAYERRSIHGSILNVDNGMTAS